MTADLRQIVIFGHFTFLHISHPNQQICTFQGSCGQLVVIFIILKGFPESRKIWRFSWPRTCEKNVIFGHFTFLHISHPNQQICTFQGSCGQLVVVFIIFKGFPESRKIWRFSWPRTCEKNVIFGHFTFLHISHPNQQICTFQGSCGQLVVIFIIFKGFPESRKIWRFSWPRTCEKNVIFGHFTFLHISHPNQQICTFQGSCGQLVVVFIIFKGFPESRKIWRFSWPRTCDKLSFLGISHFCIFLTQISKYAHFKGPVVNWWWFSSFLKAFQKVEKFEDFHDRGPATNCHFWAFHIFAYFSPKSANMHISRVLWSTGGGFHHF